MNDTNNATWKDQASVKVKQAERAVSGSLDKLEHAMKSLTLKVEDSSQNIQHLLDMGSPQKRELLRLPRPLLYGALLCLGAIFAVSYLRRDSNDDSESNQESWAA